MRIGSLFAGYGGLELGVASVLGGHPVWFSEFDAAPSKILAHRWPGVPNHGDITKVDFRDVEPVDILTGGFPCQDVSHAGKRAGIAPGTRSGLWSEFHRAIQVLRPALVVAENVRGLLSADAASDVEPCPWCVGDGGPRSSSAGTWSCSRGPGRHRVRRVVVWRTSFRRRRPTRTVPRLHLRLAYRHRHHGTAGGRTSGGTPPACTGR